MTRNDSSKEHKNVSDLPMDILIELSTWLEAKDIIRCGQTSRFMDTRWSNESIWMSKFRQLELNLVDCVDQSDKILQRRFLSIERIRGRWMTLKPKQYHLEEIKEEDDTNLPLRGVPFVYPLDSERYVAASWNGCVYLYTKKQDSVSSLVPLPFQKQEWQLNPSWCSGWMNQLNPSSVGDEIVGWKTMDCTRLFQCSSIE